MKFILARKVRMTQIFDEAGNVHPGTILKTEKMVVTQVKTKEGKEGYNAVQVGYEDQKVERVNKAQQGKAFKVLKEFRTDNVADFAAGSDVNTLDIFSVGDDVRVVGTSKGKGFQGGVKRHGFHGGRRTHGQKHSEREPGSIAGGNREGGRVPKGMRMAGRMGGDRVTVENLHVLHIDPKAGEIIISGAVPGARGTLVEVIGA